MAKECRQDGCTRSAVAQGLCDRDYRSARRAGQVEAREPDPIKRFWARVDQSGDCWEWQGARDPNGYGRVGWEGKTVLPHRVAYEMLVGPIPDGLPLDHLCRNPPCVRPEHLEPVTTRENTARGNHISATALRTNRCVRGHEYTPENTYIWRNERQCRACLRRRIRPPYDPSRPRPSKVQTTEAICDICERPFEYPKVRRARMVCSDECRRVRGNRIKATYKARQKGH